MRDNGGISVTFGKVRDAGNVMTSGRSRYRIERSVRANDSVDGQHYDSSVDLPTLAAGRQQTIYSAYSYQLDADNATARAASPLIHFDLPSASAVRPSRLIASLTRTHGRPRSMREKKPRFS